MPLKSSTAAGWVALQGSGEFTAAHDKPIEDTGAANSGWIRYLPGGGCVAPSAPMGAPGCREGFHDRWARLPAGQGSGAGLAWPHPGLAMVWLNPGSALELKWPHAGAIVDAGGLRQAGLAGRRSGVIVPVGAQHARL